MKKWMAVLLSAFLLFPAGGRTLRSTSGYGELNQMSLHSQKAYLMEADSGQVLMDVHGTEKMYPASMTKIMTVILGIESGIPLKTQVTISQEMLDGLEEADANVVGYEVGDQPTFEDLLYGAIVYSGADATNAIAMAVSGSLDTFVERMNEKAAELGLEGTHFTNSSGLHDEDHYSTCRDIAVLMQYCMQNELFRDMAGRRYYVASPVDSRPDGIWLDNYTWLAVRDSYPIEGLTALKPGFTGPAGFTLVSYAAINGTNYILVTGLADSTGETLEDAQAVYGKIREDYHSDAVVLKGQSVGEVEVHHPMYTSRMNVECPKDVTAVIPDNAEKVELSFRCPEEVRTGESDVEYAGILTVVVDGEAALEKEILFTVPKESGWIARILAVGGPAVFVVVALLAALIWAGTRGSRK